MTEHARIIELAVAGMDFPLAPAEQAKVAGHLATCAPCREILAAMRTDAGRVGALPDPQTSGRVRARVLAAAMDERGSSLFSRPQMVIAAAVLTVALIGATVAVGARVLEWLEQTRLPAPIGTPHASASPSVNATPGPTPIAFVLPDGALPPGAWVTVTSGPIDMYGWPWTDSGSSGQLESNARAQIDGVPVVVDGQTWVSVNGEGGGGYVPLQVLAAAVEVDSVSCPSASDLASVVSLTPWQRLSCFGGRELILEGSEILGFSDLMAAGDPGWLNGKGELVVTPGAGWSSLALHVPPGSRAPDRPSFDTELAPYGLRVTGHFNDPVSSTCRGPQRSIGEEGSKRAADVDPVGAQLLCREQFVLTSLEVIGATPASSPAVTGTPVLLRVDRATDVVGPWPGLDFVVFEDGRLVTASPDGSGWVERRLSDSALDELMASALGESLLQKDASYGPPAGYAAGFTTWTIRIHRASGSVTVSAANASQAEAARAVIALGDALIAKVQRLPSTAFTDEPHVWMPAAYNLKIDLSPGVLATYPTPPEFILWADDAALPLPTPLVTTGSVIHSEAGTTTRCSVIDATLASKLRAAFQRAGYQRSEGSYLAAGYSLGWRATNGVVDVSIIAVSPDEPNDFHCAGSAS